MIKYKNLTQYLIVAIVVAVHAIILAYSTFGSSKENKPHTDQAALVFIDLSSGQISSNTVAQESQSAPKQAQKKEVVKEKPVEKTVVKPVKKPKDPPIKTSKTNKSVNDVAQQTTATESTATKATDTNSTKPNTSTSQNNGVGNNNGTGNGKDNSSTPSGNSGSGTPSVVSGGSVSIAGKYPAQALENGDEGTVGVSFMVQANGSITDVQITSRARSNALNRAAKQAVQSAKVRPKTVDGKPAPTRYTTNIVFNIKS